MKKRRIEFMFVLILLFCLYAVFFTDIDLMWKWFYIAVYGVIILVSLYSLMLENRSPQFSLLWMYVLLFVPVIGYFFYLYSGQLYLKGYLFKSKRKYDREEWKKIVKDEESPDLSFLDDHQQAFTKFSSKVADTKLSTKSDTFILRNGQETFTKIKEKLKEAKRYIHMEYYIFRSDRLGKEIMQILIEKAESGVEVLFIFDAMGSMTFAGEDFEKLKKAGVQVEPFLPLKYGFFNQKFNFRNHRKIIVIDGEIGFVGGLNIGVEYLGEDPDFGFWRDTHMMMTGEAVHTLHTIFLLDWEYTRRDMVLEKYPPQFCESRELNGAVHVVASGPDTQLDIMGDLYYSLISSATKSIWIATPYFVPNESIRTALRVAAKKGIEVRIMVPEENDGFLTQYATMSYFPELLRCGVEIYSYQKGFLHQKIVIIDGNIASIGTANMDMRSFHLNFEVNVFLIGCNSIRDLVAHYEDDILDSEKIGAVDFYKRGLIKRTKESFARLFSGIL
ncbi:cardiolipin synthase [Rossellomorea sp. BNER]|uniref:cardiolipin synthase n=1 Tax=Rossellomorea sp. BNER TaxID=2962031 RepID=UPI003AF21074|nr:cardiolipin synthase [Rossellomorea sp. BNER]